MFQLKSVSSSRWPLWMSSTPVFWGPWWSVSVRAPGKGRWSRPSAQWTATGPLTLSVTPSWRVTDSSHLTPLEVHVWRSMTRIVCLLFSLTPQVQGWTVSLKKHDFVASIWYWTWIIFKMPASISTQAHFKNKCMLYGFQECVSKMT